MMNKSGGIATIACLVSLSGCGDPCFQEEVTWFFPCEIVDRPKRVSSDHELGQIRYTVLGKQLIPEGEYPRTSVNLEVQAPFSWHTEIPGKEGMLVHLKTVEGWEPIPFEAGLKDSMENLTESNAILWINGRKTQSIPHRASIPESKEVLIDPTGTRDFRFLVVLGGVRN